MLCPVGVLSVVTIFHWRNVKQFMGLVNITITGSPASAGFHLVKQLRSIRRFAGVHGTYTLHTSISIFIEIDIRI